MIAYPIQIREKSMTNMAKKDYSVSFYRKFLRCYLAGAGGSTGGSFRGFGGGG